jgi:hypothetical protein
MKGKRFDEEISAVFHFIEIVAQWSDQVNKVSSMLFRVAKEGNK